MENKEKKEGEKDDAVKNVSADKNSLTNKEQDEKESFFQQVDMRVVSLFVIGFLLGLVIKTQAVKTVVMGANDPQLERTRGDFLLTEIGKEKDQEELEEMEEVEEKEVEVKEETASAEEIVEEKVIE